MKTSSISRTRNQSRKKTCLRQNKDYRDHPALRLGSPSLLATLFWCASVRILRGLVPIPPLKPKARPAGHTSPHCQVLMATAGGQVQNSSPISCLLQQLQCGEINPPLFECDSPLPACTIAATALNHYPHLPYQEVYQMSAF